MIKYPLRLWVPHDKYLQELPNSAFVATTYLQLSNSLLIAGQYIISALQNSIFHKNREISILTMKNKTARLTLPQEATERTKQGETKNKTKHKKLTPVWTKVPVPYKIETFQNFTKKSSPLFQIMIYMPNCGINMSQTSEQTSVRLHNASPIPACLPMWSLLFLLAIPIAIQRVSAKKYSSPLWRALIL